MAPQKLGTVRIIAGRHRGRRISVPEDNVRPTGDRVREAMFNVLAHNSWRGATLPAGARVLDAFAGTGALGFEALSRGAAEVMFLETDARTRKALGRTIDELDEAKRAYVLPRDATNPGPPIGKQRFDLMFADAPYGTGLGVIAIDVCARFGWLTNGAVVVLELDGTDPFEPPRDFAVVDDRSYGRTRLVFLEYTAT